MTSDRACDSLQWVVKVCTANICLLNEDLLCYIKIQMSQFSCIYSSVLLKTEVGICYIVIKIMA